MHPSVRSADRRGRRDRRRGQALVELALILPVLLLILAGLLDFGFVLYDRMTIINASREGARAAVLRDPETQSITAAATSRVAVVDGGLTVTTAVECQRTFPGGTWSAGNCGFDDARFVRVTVSDTHSVFFLPVRWAFGDSITLRSTSQMALQ